MREIKRIAVADIVRDEGQPRKQFDEAELMGLGQNMKAIGQLVAVILVALDAALAPVRAKYQLVDGERRWRGAQLAGISELDAVVLSAKPSLGELHIVQASLDAHRVSLSAMERSNLLARIQKENNWPVGELASRLKMKQPLVSKLLSYQKLDAEVQQLLHAGQLDMERANIIAGEPDPAKQRELAKQAGGLSREHLRRRAKGGDAPVEPKSAMARFAMPGGMLVSVQGKDVTLPIAVEVLGECLRIVKKGEGQGMTLATQQKVMRDAVRAKTNGRS